MNQLYLQKRVYSLASLLVVVGALNWGLVGALNFNLVTWLAQKIGFNYLANIVFIIVGLCGLYLAFNRNYYLPFLGDTVLPCTSLDLHTPENADDKVVVKVLPNSKVIYWASEPESSSDVQQVVEDPWTAYGEYRNYGVTMADEQGHAELHFRHPVAYKIPSGKQLNKHVHYRYCINSGMLSEIKTVDV